MSQTITIELHLEKVNNDYQLQFKNEDGIYEKVTNIKPDYAVNGGDTLEWKADSSISKIKIKFLKNNILKTNDVIDNKSTHPKVTCNLPHIGSGGSGRRLYDSYEIQVKPSEGGGYKDYDPPTTYPPQ